MNQSKINRVEKAILAVLALVTVTACDVFHDLKKEFGPGAASIALRVDATPIKFRFFNYATNAWDALPANLSNTTLTVNALKNTSEQTVPFDTGSATLRVEPGSYTVTINSSGDGPLAGATMQGTFIQDTAIRLTPLPVVTEINFEAPESIRAGESISAKFIAKNKTYQIDPNSLKDAAITAIDIIGPGTINRLENGELSVTANATASIGEIIQVVISVNRYGEAALAQNFGLLVR